MPASLTQLWQSLSILGLNHPRLSQPGLPADLDKKVVLCNRMAVTIGLTLFPATFLFWSSPWLFTFYLVSVLTFMSPLLLNFLGYFTVSRLVLTITPSLYVLVGAGLTTNGPAMSQQIDLMASIVFPLLLFQLTESRKMWFGLIWIGLMLLIFEPVTRFIPRLPELVSDEQTENAATRTASGLFAFAMVTAAFLYQQRISQQTEARLAETLRLAEEKGETVWQQHEQLQRQMSEIERQNGEIERINRILRSQALKAQINPHFVFNALNSIQHFVVQKNTMEALSYLTKFAKLIRQVLENSVNERIPVADELKALTYYLDLERLRFNNAFAYQIEVDETLDVHTIEVPSMLLQPYVENAIVHGLRHRSGTSGQLTICLLYQTDQLLCVIEDNGIGRQASRAFSAGRTHISRGTTVTDNRLRLLSPDDTNPISVITLDLFDTAQQPCGTRVELVIPLL
ncbi:sensor histidine kinase [Spirosoma fluviale]|uniref:Histidine kinase n=1 Tax=Spirosoma fluviale TaxID=1597977 RepID=A0A286G9P5_9BACT|nr:histidine kinase [Spirosoma fluviale]SOD92228.1 Histidine kinase [Spirosoma fluviale]